MNFWFRSSPGVALFAVLVLAGCRKDAETPPGRTVRTGATVGPKCIDLAKSRAPASDALGPLFARVYRGNHFDRRRFDALTQGQKALWATEELDGEVNNGGFNQYFFNTEGRLLDLAITGFEAFGAREKKALATRAGAIWNTDRARLAKVRQQGTIEAFMESGKDDPYEQLDEAWFKLGDKESDGYVRAHLSEFCTQ